MKGLQEVRVPKVQFPLPAMDETTLVSNLPHCVCMSMFLVGDELWYSVKIVLDPKSAAYTTDNVQDGIRRAFLKLVNDTWVDPTKTTTTAKNDVKEMWDGKAEVPADLQRLSWESCDEGLDVRDATAVPTHHWAHIKLPTMKQKSKKKLYVIVRGGNLPWSLGIYLTWVDCHRHKAGG